MPTKSEDIRSWVFLGVGTLVIVVGAVTVNPTIIAAGSGLLGVPGILAASASVSTPPTKTQTNTKNKDQP